jgi:hypothetical protein
LNSWGVYLVAAVVLVLVLSPQLSALAASSRESADWRYLDGVREAVDSLRPGVSVAIALNSPLSPDPIRLGGRMVACSYGGVSLALATRWSLPSVTLIPSSVYLLSLQGDMVTVKRVG